MKMSPEQMEHCWLFDANIMKRALAVWGYSLMLTAIFYGVFFIIMAIIVGASSM